MLHEARQQDFRCAAIVCSVFWAENLENTRKGSSGKPDGLAARTPSAAAMADGLGAHVNDEEDFVMLGDVTTPRQKQWNLDDLIGISHDLAEEYGISKKVTIDKERISNVLKWLHVHDIVTIEGEIVTPRPIGDVHRKRETYIHLAMADHDHMWRSLAMISDGEDDGSADEEESKRDSRGGRDTRSLGGAHHSILEGQFKRSVQ